LSVVAGSVSSSSGYEDKEKAEERNTGLGSIPTKQVPATEAGGLRWIVKNTYGVPNHMRTKLKVAGFLAHFFSSFGSEADDREMDR
jgi:hypothetical protein